LGRVIQVFLVYYLMQFFSSVRCIDFLSNKIGDKINQQTFSLKIKRDDIRLYLEEKVSSFFAGLLGYEGFQCRVRFMLADAPEIFNIKYEGDGQSNSEIEIVSGRLIVNDINRTTTLSKLDKIRNYQIYVWISMMLGELILGERVTRSFIFPPGRASLINMASSQASELSKIGMYSSFFKDYDYILHYAMTADKEDLDEQFFQQNIRRLLNGEIINDAEGVFIKLNEGRQMPISAAASSIKEMFPLMMWMKNPRHMKFQSVCIEEPEAHAHPMFQKTIADLLVSCINKGAKMQITTHGDYFINRINQLLILDDVKKEKPELYQEYCEKFRHRNSLTLDRSKLSAYYFNFDNEKGQVVIEEQSLRDGIPFDSFSNLIEKNFEFDNFLEENEYDV